jgi:hypothetical protein
MISKIQNYLKFFIDRLVLQISGQLALSLFFSFYVLLPVLNLIRSLFLFRFSFFLFFFLLIFCFSLFFLFSKFGFFYEKCLQFVWSDFIFKYKETLCLGALLTRDNPFLFSFYLVLSVTCFRLILLNPDNFCIHFFYFLSVIFRNSFLIPQLGYSFLIKLNQKQSQLLVENHPPDKVLISLFKKTSLDTPEFAGNFEKWTHWINDLTPSTDSLKKISATSFLTSCFWYSLYFLHICARNFISVIQQNNLDFDKHVNSFLKNQSKNTEFDCIYQEIASKMTSKMSTLNKELNFYFEMNPVKFNLFFFFKTSDFEKKKKESFSLLLDSIILDSSSRLDPVDKQKNLRNLVYKYIPQQGTTVINNASQSTPENADSMKNVIDGSISQKTLYDNQLVNKIHDISINTSLEPYGFSILKSFF